MLYTLIPPALVILSLVGIILFLMKKAPAVADLEKPTFQMEKNVFNLRENLGGKMKSRGLWLLEKLFKGFQFVFLKLVKLFSLGGEFIRRKRNQRNENRRLQNLKNKNENFEASQTEKIEEVFQELEKNVKQPDSPSEKKTEENVPAGYNTTGKKDIFEKILIERIAANPKDIEAYERLGGYYFEIENWDYAKECFKQVIKLNPGNKNVKMKIRKLERLLGDK